MIAEDYSVTPKELSQTLKISEKTLKNWRGKQIGPSYIQIQKTIRYSLKSIQEWLRNKAKN